MAANPRRQGTNLAPARIPLDMRGAITEAPLQPGRPQGGRFEHLSVGVDNSHYRHRAVRAQASSSSTRLSRRAKSNTSTYGRIDGIPVGLANASEMVAKARSN